MYIFSADWRLAIVPQTSVRRKNRLVTEWWDENWNVAVDVLSWTRLRHRALREMSRRLWIWVGRGNYRDNLQRRGLTGLVVTLFSEEMRRDQPFDSHHFLDTLNQYHKIPIAQSSNYFIRTLVRSL